MKEYEFLKLTSVANRTEAEQILQFLHENNINAYCRGGIMDIYMGNSITGEEIMVSEKDMATAQEIINHFQPIKVTGKNSKHKGIIGWILLFILFMSIVLPIIL